MIDCSMSLTRVLWTDISLRDDLCALIFPSVKLTSQYSTQCNKKQWPYAKESSLSLDWGHRFSYLAWSNIDTEALNSKIFQFFDICEVENVIKCAKKISYYWYAIQVLIVPSLSSACQQFFFGWNGTKVRGVA